MRRIAVFKGYGSTIEYDELTGEFKTITRHPPGCGPSQEEMLAALAQVLTDPDSDLASSQPSTDCKA